MSLLGLALGVGALILGVFVVGLLWGKGVMAWRARHHDGTYLVRMVPRGGQPWLLDDEFPSSDAAGRAATDTLVGRAPDAPPTVAEVLARRRDGTWDVVDHVHVLG